jgi:hypothetical protein
MDVRSMNRQGFVTPVAGKEVGQLRQRMKKDGLSGGDCQPPDFC